MTTTGSNGFGTVVRREIGSLVVIATVTAVLIWFAGTSPDQMTRAVSALLGGLAAFVCAAIGLTAFSGRGG